MIQVNQYYTSLVFFMHDLCVCVTGRQPVGLEVFIGSIAKLMKGEINKASVVDIGTCVLGDITSDCFYSAITAGCGTGNYASGLSPYVGKITGVEYNPGMLKQAKAKTANLKNIELLQGDGTKIPLCDSYCDVVYTTQVYSICNNLLCYNHLLLNRSFTIY